MVPNNRALIVIALTTIQGFKKGSYYTANTTNNNSYEIKNDKGIIISLNEKDFQKNFKLAN